MIFLIKKTGNETNKSETFEIKNPFIRFLGVYYLDDKSAKFTHHVFLNKKAEKTQINKTPLPNNTFVFFVPSLAGSNFSSLLQCQL